MIGWSGFAVTVRNTPVVWLRNCAPTSSMYFGEFRKQYVAQCNGMNPLPLATYSSNAFSWSGLICVWLANTINPSCLFNVPGFKSARFSVYVNVMPRSARTGCSCRNRAAGR